MMIRIWQPLAAAALSAIPLLTRCSGKESKAPPPMPEVAVVTVQPEKVVLSRRLPGRTSGYVFSEVRPQVTGLIKERLFTEGADVKVGDPLYQVDPAPFEAARDSAAANVAAAKKAADRARAALGASIAGVAKQRATVALAKTNRQRFEDLFKDKAVSASERDQAVTEADVADAAFRAAEAQVESDRAAIAAAEAAIAQAEAASETARINLGYTRITAPIAGRIGRSNVTQGALVTAYQVVLATIQQLDPIYVDVPQSTVELNRLRRALAAGRLDRNGTDRVKLALVDGTEYPLEGELKFQDVTVDPTTGSVILRIVVPNPEGVLLPGMFVRAIIEEGVHPRAILVPQQAVSRDPRGNPIALVVGPGDKVVQRSLTTDRAIGDKWLVSSGLEPGDRVIVDGLQRVRAGAVVRIASDAAQGAATTQPATQPITRVN